MENFQPIKIFHYTIIPLYEESGGVIKITLTMAWHSVVFFLSILQAASDTLSHQSFHILRKSVVGSLFVTTSRIESPNHREVK